MFNSIVSRGGVGILVSILLLSLACARPPAPPPPAPPEKPAVAPATLVITPVAGKPELPFTIHGAGFIPGEKITLILEIEGVLTALGTVPGGIHTANELGAFRTSSAFPVGAKPGVYVVKATGDKGSKAIYPIEVLK